MTIFVALGDSITLGVGDPVRLESGPRKRGWRGWAALLAEALPDPALHVVATNGARMSDLESDQLPKALQLRPEVASVVIGVNDTLRANFDPDKIAESAAHTVGALRAAGAEVLTMRLPDPGRMLGLPDLLARPLARRARDLNDAMDHVAERFGTLHFDAARDAEAYDPRMWAVDRLHPSERGHRLIARRFHALLADAGFPVGAEPGAEPVNAPPTRLAEFCWMATKGTAWVMRRSTDLVPSLVGMAINEWRSGGEPLADEQAERLADPDQLADVERLMDAEEIGAATDDPSESAASHTSAALSATVPRWAVRRRDTGRHPAART
jgi:lysophospholipase L1-like esterase